MPRRLPPTWLLGLANLPFSISSTILLITVPQLLSARHVPEPVIASITAVGLIPGFASILVSPMLDVWLSRRSYALAMAAVASVAALAALTRLDDLAVLPLLLFVANVGANLYQAALGGWLGSIVPPEEDSRLGAWMIVANIAGFGIDAIVNIALVRSLPSPFGAAAVAGLVLLPLLLFLPIPAPGPDRRLARESYAEFAAHLGRMLRRPGTIRAILVFVLPAACFALTNALGGLGGDYGASERFVSLVAGVGVTIAGIVGSLMVPRLAARFEPYRLYVAIGLVGAVFTLALIVLPRTPAVFALAMVGENVAQAAAFATATTIIFREIGKGNPLAATEFSVLISAVLLPLAYMQWLDGRGYAAAGLAGSLGVDGAMGLAGCAGILLVLAWVRRRVPRPSSPALAATRGRRP